MQIAERIRNRLDTLTRQYAKLGNQKICIKTTEGINIININQITRIEADRAYSIIHFSSSESLVVSKPLKELTDSLPIDSFVRIHASHLINLDFIKRYMIEDGGYVVLSCGLQLPVARRRKQEFLKFLREHVVVKSGFRSQ